LEKLEIHSKDNQDKKIDQLVLFINEEILSKSPQIEIQFENKEVVIALLDSGSEVNLISQNKFDQLERSGIELLTLPVQGINLVTAFGKRSKSIKLQLLAEFSINEEKFEAVFLVAPQLNCDVILGCQFLKKYGIQLCFDLETVEYVRQGQLKIFRFKKVEDREKEVQTEEIKALSYLTAEENHGNDPGPTKTIDGLFEEVNVAYTHANCRDVLTRRDYARCDDVTSDCIPEHRLVRVDTKDIQTGELFHIIDRSSEINSEQKLQLFQTLHKYLPFHDAARQMSSVEIQISSEG
jgi:hypothetical protein